MNFLILAAGTRNKIVQYFKRTFDGVGSVVATDASLLGPAIYDADKYYIVPPITEEGYIDKILEICRIEQISGVLSLIDPELSLLAENEEKFNALGVTIIGSSYELCEMALDKMQMNLLKTIADLEKVPDGAFNIRLNGGLESRNNTENITIETKKDKPGIDIYIKAGTKNERVDIPVIVSKTGLKDLVYNDFYVGEDADVLIVAGCGIHNDGSEKSQHDGIHAFHLAKNAKVKYVEKHYGEGEGTGERVLNPTTEVDIAEGGYLEMETAQIKGVDSTKRVTRAVLGDKATLIIHEKIMTHGKQSAETDFAVDMNGFDCGAHVVSRSVAKDSSHQHFTSLINGNNQCNGHTECDAIIMDSASVTADPKLTANHVDASLIHEAAIGKIAGEQLVKLMTLGLSEKEAEEQIVNGFLK